MKKLLITTMVLMIAGSTTVFAADNSTYTGQWINKYTQKITDSEKQLQEKQKAREDAIKKQKAENAKKQAEFKKQIEAKQKAHQDAIKKQQAENAKKQAEFKKQIEAKQKANKDAAAARQKKWQEKKDAWNKLISE